MPAQHPSAAPAALTAAARLSLHAPSVFNTQPWRWRISGDTAELRADPARRLTVTDPDGRLLALSCGTALHHARVALAAAGWRVDVDRTPDPTDPDLVARLTLAAAGPEDTQARRMVDAMPRRRTDRRGFSDEAVSEHLLTVLRRAVEHEGTYLHLVRPEQLPLLAGSTTRAATDELDDPDYRTELARWTARPAEARDGVPATTAVRTAPRTVPVRDFTPDGEALLDAGPGTDRGAAYVVLFGADDDRAAWLRAGEALSALLLTATAEGLASAPLSDAIEQDWPRRLLHELLAGIGEPYVVVRVGHRVDDTELPPTPRRDPAEVIDVVDQ